ncbi:MAG: hypothetical protein NZ988_03740 [Thaumarchaeota archaeon]|nr:hypothetical protein [Candidatus Calditenuaceae archaeon]MDW8187142.1 hypothetical protein [Nitrososphaerota archaeon]
MLVADQMQPLVALTAALLLALVLVRVSMSLSNRLGLVGRDVHKPYTVYVPKIGGVGVVISYVAVVSTLTYHQSIQHLLALVAVPAISSVFGLLEDFRELNPYLKPLLLAIPGVLMVTLGTYDPYPVLPIIGKVRLTILYPLILVIAYSVVTNAVNSIDVVNGSLAFFAIATSCTLLAALTLGGAIPELQLAAAALLGSVLGFLRYNWYPARTFAGNVGSNFVASSLLTLAVLGKLEVLVLVALLPAILNEALIITSVGGLKSGKRIVKRPILVLSGVIRDNPDVSAPLTLIRMLAAGGDLNERRVSIAIGALTAFSCVLALATLLFYNGMVR